VTERVGVAALAAFLPASLPAQTTAERLAPATMPRVATVDERFQSYNVEMVEVTGGRFWKPYDALASRGVQSAANIAMQADTRLQRAIGPQTAAYPEIRPLSPSRGPRCVSIRRRGQPSIDETFN
jgi:hypothetical protein